MPATLAAELLKTPVEDDDCFKQRREACRNEFAAMLDILAMLWQRYVKMVNLVEEAKVFGRGAPFEEAKRGAVGDWLQNGVFRHSGQHPGFVKEMEMHNLFTAAVTLSMHLLSTCI
jgi:hypothetical protein